MCHELFRKARFPVSMIHNNNSDMKLHQIAESITTVIHSDLSPNRVNEIIQADYNHSYQPTEKDIGHVLQIFRVFMKLHLTVCLFCIGTVAAMGSGSAGGGSAKSKSLQQEVGSSAFEVYNQGVDLMHAKKFAEAQMKFEQAIRDNPNFAEAHNNLGFTLRQQGPQSYSQALEHYSKAIQLKPSMAETYEYRGVLFAKMGRKADAAKDLATLKKLNTKLADELEEFLKTGKEEDEYGPTSPKQKS
jgi:tetratricopeptide (TPR) repeat protein